MLRHSRASAAAMFAGRGCALTASARVRLRVCPLLAPHCGNPSTSSAARRHHSATLRWRRRWRVGGQPSSSLFAYSRYWLPSPTGALGPRACTSPRPARLAARQNRAHAKPWQPHASASRQSWTQGQPRRSRRPKRGRVKSTNRNYVRPPPSPRACHQVLPRCLVVRRAHHRTDPQCAREADGRQHGHRAGFAEMLRPECGGMKRGCDRALAQLSSSADNRTDRARELQLVVDPFGTLWLCCPWRAAQDSWPECCFTRVQLLCLSLTAAVGSAIHLTHSRRGDPLMAPFMIHIDQSSVAIDYRTPKPERGITAMPDALTG